MERQILECCLYVVRTGMKNVLVVTIVLCLLGTSTPVRARYRPLNFVELCTRADLVVLGTVVSTTDETFTLEVERTVRSGRSTPSMTRGEPLEIVKFQNWTCARRWTEYAAGQKAVMFLELRSGSWHVLGGGNEGEMPVLGDWIFVNTNVSSGFGEWTVYNARYFGGRLAVQDVLKAVVAGKPLRGHVDGAPHNQSSQAGGGSHRR